MKKKTPALLLSISLLFVFISCSGKDEIRSIPLPETSVFPIHAQWGVVTSHFLRLRENPDSKATILAHLRGGTAVEILTRSTKREVIEGQNSYWFQVNYNGLKGWIFGGYLKEFNSKSAALEYTKELK